MGNSRFIVVVLMAFNLAVAARLLVAKETAMVVARHGHTATLLPDGRVLIVGGFDGQSMLKSVEMFDPAVGRFRASGSMQWARNGHTATLLSDGRVFVAGGGTAAEGEIYDTSSGTFSETRPMIRPRSAHAAA